MGNIQDLIKSNSFSFQNNGVDENKHRLVKTYKTYIEKAKEEGKDEEVFKTLNAQFNDDKSALADLTDHYNLTWQANPDKVLEFFNNLTEEQAIQYTKALEPYIPAFKQEGAQA